MATSFSSSYNAKISDEARHTLRTAPIEGAALAGQLGLDAQLIALSAKYIELRGQGKATEAAAVKAEAMALHLAAQEGR